MNLNLTSTIKMPDHQLRRQVIDLCQKVGKPLLKLSTRDYVDNGLQCLVEQFDGQAGLVNIEVFNELQHTITGWPGGKPGVDDSTRPERANPYPKRVVVFSPHPDDDVISMGGTIRRLMQQGHDVHIAYETSGNIAVGDEEVSRFMHFINGFNTIFANGSDEVIKHSYQTMKEFLKNKHNAQYTMDNETVLRLKGLIRRFFVEPGRYVVAEAGALLGQITATKFNGQTHYVGTDLGFNVLMRPVLYDSYHEIEVYPKNPSDEEPFPQTVTGNICESGDILARDRMLPKLTRGDFIVLLDAGAYGYSMSSCYNQRQRPAEVLINSEGQAKLIRRRESLSDLTACFNDLD